MRPTSAQRAVVLEIIEGLKNPTVEAVEAAFDAAGWLSSAASRRAWLRRMGLYREAALLVVRPRASAAALTRGARERAVRVNTEELVVQLETELTSVKKNLRNVAKILGHMRMWLQKGTEPLLPDDLRQALAALQLED